MEDVLDHSTLGKNVFGSHYNGPDNPSNYPDKNGNRKPNYSEPPVNAAGYPAIIHDKAYGLKGVSGADGLLNAESVIADDWDFVINQYKVARGSHLIKDYKTARQAAALGTGLGVLATPKTTKKYFWEPFLIGFRAMSDQR